MKRILTILCLFSLSACSLTGLGPSAGSNFSNPPTSTFTPRSKGGTLNITPRTKGGTLFNGSIVWPTEVAALDSKVFLIKVYQGETLLAEGETNDSAQFTVNYLPANSLIRIEAHVPGRPFVTLRNRYQTAPQDSNLEPKPVKAELSMLSTAADSVLQMATANSPLKQLMPQDLLAQSTTQLKPLAELMTPYLDQTNLSQEIYLIPVIETKVVETLKAIEETIN